MIGRHALGRVVGASARNERETIMKEILKITAATAALAFGLSGANAAMLLHTDPQSGEKVIVDTDDPNYRERVIEGTGGTEPPEGFPEGAWLLTEDDTGQKLVVNPSTNQRYWLSEQSGTGGTERPAEIPEGAFFLTEDPQTGEKEVYTSPMEAPRAQ